MIFLACQETQDFLRKVECPRTATRAWPMAILMFFSRGVSGFYIPSVPVVIACSALQFAARCVNVCTSPFYAPFYVFCGSLLRKHFPSPRRIPPREVGQIRYARAQEQSSSMLQRRTLVFLKRLCSLFLLPWVRFHSSYV